MKNRSYANRGSSFEQFINFANERYRRSGIAFIRKQCTEFIPIRDRYGKINNVKVEHKATFDYLGRFKSHPIAVEAKNTNIHSIRFDRIEPNQAEDMDDFTSEKGTIGLVLLSFNLETFYAVPWAFWSTAYRIRVKQGDTKTPILVRCHGQAWEIPKKHSVREDELLPEWQVSSRDMHYGLHYLVNAEKYAAEYSTETQNT